MGRATVCLVGASLVAGLALAAGSAAAVGGGPSFGQPRFYPLGEGRGYISDDQLTAADLDADGDLDSVMVTGPSVGILLNDGDGTFDGHPAVLIPVDGDAVSADVGDVDGDGAPDLVVLRKVDGDLFVDVMKNDGSAGFDPATAATYVAGSGARPSDLTLADLDGDGALDVVFRHWGVYSQGNTNYDGGYVVTLRNDGDGTFDGTAASKYFSLGWHVERVAVADLDGDGDPDLIGAGDVYEDRDGDGELEARPVVGTLLNDGTGSFDQESWTVLGTAGGTHAMTVAGGDVDGDGDNDVVVSHYTADSTGTPEQIDAEVFLNDGAGVLSPDSVSVPLPRASYLGPLAASDVDGDSDADLVYAIDDTLFGGSTRGFGIVLSNGDATFAPAIEHADNSDPGSIVVADLDGDGLSDLLSTSEVYDPASGGGVAAITVRTQQGAPDDGHVTCPAGNSAGVVCTEVAGHLQIVGTSGRDTLVGTAAADVLEGNAGRDTIRTGGDDVITPGPGADTVRVGGGDDLIRARDKTCDDIDGGGGRDTAVRDRKDVLRSVERLK